MCVGLSTGSGRTERKRAGINPATTMGKKESILLLPANDQAVAGFDDRIGSDSKHEKLKVPISLCGASNHANALLPLWNDGGVSAVDDETAAHCIGTPPQIQGLHLFTKLAVPVPTNSGDFLAIKEKSQ